MRTKVLSIAVTAVFFLGLVIAKNGFCYKVPPKDSNISYLYVFGPDGKKGYGATKAPQVVFLRVPGSYTGTVEISVYDPDVGDYLDEKSGSWNTETRFSIFGGEKAYSSLKGVSDANVTDFRQGTLISEKIFGQDESYDRQFYHFSPIDASMGEKIGDYRYFKIVAEGITGDDNNVFAFEVSPDQAESFSQALNLRLSEKRGKKMLLYPDMPKDASKIVEYNFDLDPDGGDIELISSTKAYRVKGSGTGVWANTKIDVDSGDAGKRWVYEITKATQPNANMAMYLTTSDGEAIPVFFNPGAGGPKMVFVEAPKTRAAKIKEEPWLESKLSCNTFTFDGSKSYDPDDQELSYFWDFGDGTTSTQVRSMHTYKDAGKYLVKLTVTDNSEAECDTAATQQMVKVNQPPCAVAIGPKVTCVNNEIIFDGTQSTDSPEDKLTYRWDFGDGKTMEGAKVTHKYAKGGNYLVTLTVADDSGTMCDTGVDRLNVAVNTPPVADAGSDFITCKKGANDPLEVTFDASKTKDADGDQLTYVWDFGDGETAEGKTVTHKYAKGGEYIAKLLVTDGTGTDCNKSTAKKVVTLNRAPMADAGDNKKICLTEKADFDAASSYDTDGDTITYTWDFGDGKTAEGKAVSHKFEKGGAYKVKLTVNDGSGMDCASADDTILVDVNSTPSADIKTKDLACVKEDIKFDGAGSSDPDGDRLNHTWDFGDGTTATGSSANHSYAKGGMYKATLFVDDGKGSDCSGATKVQYVNINTPPIAEAGPDLKVCVNDEIEFDGSKSFDEDSDKLAYAWDFGDGTTAAGPKVKHAYKDIGAYKITLTVTDDSGTACSTSVDTLVAIVNAEPFPVIEVM
ncbi:MAG: PKD domain-containing protein [Candidatus Omnitrophica bacterium]|nr:PKD domain-containing protein [Candidatus Omnitrophota bacterium]